MASKKILQNRINKLIDKLKADPLFYPNVKVTDDQYWDEPSPILTVSTDYQIIMFMIEDDLETVSTKVRMHRGAGSEKDFAKKLECMEVLRKYTKKHYKDENLKIVESLGNIKITTDTEIHTLICDPKSLEVSVKTRLRRGAKKSGMLDNKATQIPDFKDSVEGKTKLLPEIPVDSPKPTKIFEEPFELNIPPVYPKIGDAISISEPDPKFIESLSIPTTHHVGTKSLEEKPKRHRRTKAEMQAAREAAKKQEETEDPNQTTLDQFFDKEYIGPKEDDSNISFEIREYDTIPEGSIVKNNYSNKEYKVVKSSKTAVVEVFDKEHGYLTMARADLKVI